MWLDDSAVLVRLQSLSCPHPPHQIGEGAEDPDFAYMLSEGVYESRTRSQFILRYLVIPLLGMRILHYPMFLLRDRSVGPLLDALPCRNFGVAHDACRNSSTCSLGGNRLGITHFLVVALCYNFRNNRLVQ